MTELAAGEAPVRLVAGRSLWGDAWSRLRANKAAMASLIYLVAMTIACIVGPFFVPHLYTTIYPDYVRTPPSLSPYPTEATVEDRALRRREADARRHQGMAPRGRPGLSSR